MTEMIFRQGNQELLGLLRTRPFDFVRAKSCLPAVAELNATILDERGHPTSYLSVATEESNYDAVLFLLENGADPNHLYPEEWDCPLWNLQYFTDNPADDKIRLNIAKLFFEYGADPAMRCEGEYLYDSVVYEVYNEQGGRMWEYFI